MIPLRLSLIPQEVQPEGIGKKTVRVLQLTAPYKLADLYRYVALPRGQAILPEPDLETPEDLFLPEAEEMGTRALPSVPETTADEFFAGSDDPPGEDTDIFDPNEEPPPPMPAHVTARTHLEAVLKDQGWDIAKLQNEILGVPLSNYLRTHSLDQAYQAWKAHVTKG